MVKTVCTTSCYTGGKLWNPGEKRIFSEKKKIEPCFAFLEDVKELEEGPPAKSFSQLSLEEYIALAVENEIEIPAELTKRDDIKKFLAEKLDQK